MRHLTVVLVLVTGALAGFYFHEARAVRGKLQAERQEYRRSLEELESRLLELEAKSAQVLATRREAIEAWNRRSLEAQTAPKKKPPRAYRGMGGK